MAAEANKMKRKGYEATENYRNCTLSFMDIRNIHTMRESLQALRQACEHGVDGDPNFLSKVHSSSWLQHIQGIVTASVRVAELLHCRRSSVLVHCR
jgi:hypothetical protein